MKRTTTFCILFLSFLCVRAGFVIGYQGGGYAPGMANVQSTMYYYNKVFGADFKYYNLFHGVFLGIRYDGRSGWISMAWNNKHNTFTSEYTNGGEKYKFSIRPRMNELIIDGGYKYHGWGLGIGINMANFVVFTKRAKIEAFDAEPWGQEYGAPIKLFGLPDFPSFSFLLERELSRYLILRGTYHFGVGDVKMDREFLFLPNNLTVALLLNIRKSKRY